MFKLGFKLFSVTALVPTLLVSQLQKNTAFTDQQLNQQVMLAVNWVQQSGEYRALTYQAFNLAKVNFDHAKAKNISHPAIVLDIDETVLDNSPYQAGLLDTNKGYETSTWNQWIKTEKAEAIPGSVEFVNYVNKHGGQVFFVSNRTTKSVKSSQINDLEIATINNLKKVGFTGVNENTVLLKGEFTKVINGKEDSSKKWRIDAIKNGSVNKYNNKYNNKYTIIALMGDNLNDFDENAGINNQQRRDFVDKNRNFYGMFNVNNKGVVEPAYIALPNPMYGNWETAMYNPKVFNKQSPLQMTPGEKNQQRRESLNLWVAK